LVHSATLMTLLPAAWPGPRSRTCDPGGGWGGTLPGSKGVCSYLVLASSLGVVRVAR